MQAGALITVHNSAHGVCHLRRQVSLLQGLNTPGVSYVFSEYKFLNDCSAAILEEACKGQNLMLQ